MCDLWPCIKDLLHTTRHQNKGQTRTKAPHSSTVRRAVEKHIGDGVRVDDLIGCDPLDHFCASPKGSHHGSARQVINLALAIWIVQFPPVGDASVTDRNTIAGITRRGDIGCVIEIKR